MSDPHERSSASPLESAQKVADNREALDRLGVTGVEFATGQATVRMTVAKEMANGHHVAHGAFIFGLADTAFALAANSVEADSVTADARITYLAPGWVGQQLVAEGRVTFHEGRRTVVDVVVKTDDGSTIALFRGHGRGTSKSSSS